jgi:CubicO group peptidase (beta-lactamase class C family)
MPFPRRRPWRTWAAACALLLSSVLAQPDLTPRALEADELDAATIQRAALRFELDTIVYETFADTGVPGIVVALAWGGEPLAAEAYGTADVTTGRELTLDDPLWVASVTKTPVSIAVLALAADGRLDLDAPLETLLPPGLLPPPTAGDAGPLTARHLLTHTGGFDERLLNTADASGGPNPPLATLPLPPRVEPAGAGPRYGNAGHQALGLLLEAVTGHDVETALQDLVFAPLGMTSARLLRPADDGYEAATARGHERLGSGELRLVTMPTLLDPTAGQLRLSGRDAARLLEALTAEAPPAPLADGVRTALITPTARPHPLAPGTTLGMWEGRLLGHDVVLQPGELPGVRSLLLIAPEAGLAMFLHVNGPERDGGDWATADGLRDPLWLLAERIVARFVGDARTPPRAVPASTLPDAARVAPGVYRPTRVARTGPESLLLLAGLAQFPVRVEPDGAVVVQTPASLSPARRYVPTEGGVYVHVGGGDVLVAGRDPRGEPLLHGTLGLPLTLERVPALERTGLVLGTAWFGLWAAVLALVTWPIGAWGRWRAREPRGREPGRALVALRRTARVQAVAILAWLAVVVQMIVAAQRTLAYDATAWWPVATAAWALLLLCAAALTLTGAALALRGTDPASAAPRLRPRAIFHALLGVAGLALALQGWVWRLPPWG